MSVVVVGLLLEVKGVRTHHGGEEGRRKTSRIEVVADGDLGAVINRVVEVVVVVVQVSLSTRRRRLQQGNVGVVVMKGGAMRLKMLLPLDVTEKIVGVRHKRTPAAGEESGG